MLKKCLIALILMALVGGSIAQAHPTWGVTTAMAYDWAKKEANVDVYIKVVRWAQVYTKYAVVLTQQPNGEFCGCTWMQVCVNFMDLRMEAELFLDDTITGEDLAEKWYLALADSGMTDALDAPEPPSADCVPQVYTQVIGDGADPSGKATMVLAGPHLTGSLAWVSLCVKATGVDPQALEFFQDGVDKANIRKIGTVKITYYPDRPPTASDWAESFTTDPAGYEYESGLPNVPGGIPNGSGADHGLPAI